MNNKWKKMDSEIIYEHPKMTVILDKIQLPNGVRGDYIYRKHDVNASTIICEENGKILLQKEYSYPPNEMVLQFPGGAIALDEDPIEGTNRELREEFGYRAENLQLLGQYLVDNRRCADIMYVYLARDLVEDNLPNDDVEILEHSWHEEVEIDQMIKDGKIRNPHALASWSIYKSTKT